ncbi:hypothetical protein [Alcaligenes sp. Marseille-Q7550]
MKALEIVTEIYGGLPMGVWFAAAILVGALGASTWIVLGKRDEEN